LGRGPDALVVRKGLREGRRKKKYLERMKKKKKKNREKSRETNSRGRVVEEESQCQGGKVSKVKGPKGNRGGGDLWESFCEIKG